MQEFKPSVLVVEDDEGIRNLIVTILRLYGFNALYCSDAAEAEDLMAIHGNYIQLLVTDVNLGPFMGGVELAHTLRDQYAHLKILYVSGLVEEKQISQEVYAGRALFLPKPFTPKGLTSKVISILGKGVRLALQEPVLD